MVPFDTLRARESFFFTFRGPRSKKVESRMSIWRSCDIILGGKHIFCNKAKLDVIRLCGLATIRGLEPLSEDNIFYIVKKIN